MNVYRLFGLLFIVVVCAMSIGVGVYEEMPAPVEELPMEWTSTQHENSVVTNIIIDGGGSAEITLELTLPDMDTFIDTVEELQYDEYAARELLEESYGIVSDIKVESDSKNRKIKITSKANNLAMEIGDVWKLDVNVPYLFARSELNIELPLNVKNLKSEPQPDSALFDNSLMWTFHNYERGSSVVLSYEMPAVYSSPVVGRMTEISNSVNGSWQFYKDFNIKENSGHTLTNYQVLFELSGTDFPLEDSSDGEDIKFTESSGLELNYWVEEWDDMTQTARIWVKVPRISAGDSMNIRMWYGNPTATSRSDGDATFVFFDDFDGSNVDATKWQQGAFGNGGLDVLSYSNSVFTYRGSGCGGNIQDWRYMRSTDTWDGNEIALSAKTKRYNGINHVGFGYGGTTGVDAKMIDIYFSPVYGENRLDTILSTANVGSSSPTNYFYDMASEIWYTVDLMRYHDTVNARISDSNGDILNTTSTDVSITDDAFIFFNGVYNCIDVRYSYDWVFVRNFALIEPTLTIMNTGELSIDVNRPQLTIISPNNGATVSTQAITVSGTASDDTVVASVLVNGKVATGTTVWSKDTVLTEGPNTIYVKVTDTSGNIVEKSINIMYNPSTDTESLIDYSWFENNAELRIQATDLMIMYLEPYNDTAKNYFTNLNKDIKDQVLFPILIEFGNTFSPLPIDYNRFDSNSVENINENTKATLQVEGLLSSSEIVTVASYDLKALNMLLWYNDAIQNIDATEVVDDSGQSVMDPLDSSKEIDDLNFYKQLLVQERDYWVAATNAKTLEGQKKATTNAMNIINQEKLIMGTDSISKRDPNSLYKHISDNSGFYIKARLKEGLPKITANLLLDYFQKQQDYVDDFDINNIDIVAISLSNEDDTKATSDQESVYESTQKTSITTIITDALDMIVGWFGSIF